MKVERRKESVKSEIIVSLKCFLPEMHIQKKRIWIDMLRLDPSRVYLSTKTKVSTLKPSLTVLVENNKGQNQRNNKIVFLASRV